MQVTEKVPVTVITGFLGSGKTSLVRHLLENAGGKRLAFIINEFGDLGVDAEILRGCGIEDCTDDDVIELTNGCICCTVADDFLPTLGKLLDRDEPPEHILIETSGLALPKPLVQAFQWPEVRTRATVDGVIAVVDGPAVASGLFASDAEAVQAQRLADPSLDHESPLEELFEDQLSCADIVLVSKADLMDAADAEAILGEVARKLNGRVKPIAVENGRLRPELVLGLGVAAEDDLDARPSHHDGEEDHEHDEFESLVIELPPVGSAAKAERVAAALLALPNVLRVKGFAGIEGRAARLVLQGFGRRVQRYFDRPWAENETPATRLVVIGLSGIGDLDIRAAALEAMGN